VEIALQYGSRLGDNLARAVGVSSFASRTVRVIESPKLDKLILSEIIRKIYVRTKGDNNGHKSIVNMNKMESACIFRRPKNRRILPFQGGNTGSNPVGVASFLSRQHFF
jgi:hypothetical protein